MRFGVVTSRDYATLHADDRPLVDALLARAVQPVPLVWDDDGVDWTAYDLVVVRTPWDYYKRIDAFTAWLARLEALGAPVVNPVRTLRWNADKRYLVELAADGWDSLPTASVERGDTTPLAALLAARGWDDVVVKPTVSGGAWHTFRSRAGEAAAREAQFRALVARADALVQPYLPEIESAGEWSLLHFGGAYSHAVLKEPKAGDFRVQSEFGGAVRLAEPPPAAIEAARRGLDRLPALGHPGCLYARVDGVMVDGVFRLMELELIEPQLFFTQCPAGAERYADVLVSAVATAVDPARERRVVG